MTMHRWALLYVGNLELSRADVSWCIHLNVTIWDGDCPFPAPSVGTRSLDLICWWLHRNWETFHQAHLVARGNQRHLFSQFTVGSGVLRKRLEASRKPIVYLMWFLGQQSRSIQIQYTRQLVFLFSIADQRGHILTKFRDTEQTEASLHSIRPSDKGWYLAQCTTWTKGHNILNFTALHINPKCETMCRLSRDLTSCKK